VEAVGDRIPVLLDGGVRRGADVVKAVALGARACLIGRPQLWGLAVAGEAGVAHVLDIYRREIDRVMGLCGVARIADIGPDLLFSPPPRLVEPSGQSTSRNRRSSISA
jgi:L-lactate dehydrogenase (cytochrome)/(S)-mandelate dehydrogenase